MADKEEIQPTREEVAIIGIGCRFPGADDSDEFWRVLVNGENHVRDIPPDRWNNEVFYDKDKDAAGKIYITKAGLLEGHDEFDPTPFGICDAEAERMDPQQRYVLECVHMAMQDAGILKADLDGSKTGVYIGFMNDDYKTLFESNHTEDNVYTATGTSPTIIANRVNYVYNLQGPSMAIDTACSSSLVALHLARQAIIMGDCDMAICGGVSSIISPEIFIPLCRSRLLSAVGQCQTFCDTADGYVRSEGCGIVILKKLKKTLEDGNKIWATFNTAVNQDGHTVHPITCPSEEQQIRLLQKSYTGGDGDQLTVFDVDPSSVQYIEAHGDWRKADKIENSTRQH